MFARLLPFLLVAALFADSARAPLPASAATCTGSVGPGIPPPAAAASGTAGFHAQWYGQSGYPTLCPGERSTATVAYLNSGSLGWVAGVMGEAAYLGTWGPEPGQDRASRLGGDGQFGSPATGWPRYNRIAAQPAAYVGPGQVAWFQFAIQAPATPGTYRLGLRPLVEGAAWLEDFGVFWQVTVLNPDGSMPASAASRSGLGYQRLAVLTDRGTFTASVIKEPLAEVSVRTMTANATDCRTDCPAKPLADYVAQAGGFAGMNGTYLCPPDYVACAGKVNSYDYAVFSSDLGRWINAPALIGQNGLATFANGRASFLRRSYVFDARTPIEAGITMFPLLLQGGVVVDSEAEQTPQQKVRGTKGSIGSDGTHVYLVLVSSATITESAHVLQALGIRDALNLDGGGTAAMYADGTYTVGPGRLLPNAVVLVRR